MNTSLKTLLSLTILCGFVVFSTGCAYNIDQNTAQAHQASAGDKLENAPTPPDLD